MGIVTHRFSIIVMFVSMSLCSLHAADDKLPAIVSKYLPVDTVLVLSEKGDFGAGKKCSIAIYQERECSECLYSGLALMPKNSSEYQTIKLPEFRQFDNVTVENSGIAGILFVDVDTDGQSEVMILVKGQRRGPDGYPLMTVAVLDWTGKTFKALEPVERYFSDICSTVNDVRAMISALAMFPGVFVSETPGVMADLEVVLTDQGRLTATWSALYSETHTCGPVSFTVKPNKGKGDLVSMNKTTGEDERIGVIQIAGRKAVVTFLKNMADFDCGAGHPREIRLKRK